MSEMEDFLRTRSLLDIPEDRLIDWATTCSNAGMREHAKFLLRKMAARDGKALRSPREERPK